VASLTDERSVRAALKGVDTVIHLASAERQGARGDIVQTDSLGTKNLASLSAEMKVKKFIYISHLGADRASYYPILKMKGIAEDHIRKSGVPFTIIRSAILYGPGDHFTTSIAKLLAIFPLFFLPKNGENLLQPLHIDDLIMAMMSQKRCSVYDHPLLHSLRSRRPLHNLYREVISHFSRFLFAKKRRKPAPTIAYR